MNFEVITNGKVSKWKEKKNTRKIKPSQNFDLLFRNYDF